MNKVLGFEKEQQFLFNAFKSNNLNNSIIISGQKGIGKKTFLFSIIKDFFKLSIDPINLNHHFNLLLNNTHPNIKYVTKEFDEKTKKLKSYININQIRNLKNFSNESSLIKDLLKIIIIDSADDLNNNSSNSILKILEEPKKNTFIFLISHQLSSLLPTIRSRCLKIKCQNHNIENFKIILQNKFIDIDDELINFLYDISNGSPGIAMQFNDEEIFDLFDEFSSSLILKKPLSDNNIRLSSKLAEFDNDKLKIFISILKFILLNLSKIKIGVNVFDLYISEKIKNLLISSEHISQKTIMKKLEYLINNENDLFTYNLDKRNFLINFFSVAE